MEKVERQSEEASFLWLPFHFLNQTIKAILRCLGLLHHDPPTVKKTSSDSAPLNQPEEEEEDDVVMEDNLVVTTMGSKNGIVITNRGTKVQAKKRGKENFSPGRPGKHH
ncbi:Elicitor peptide 1 [Raphanus sativus]|uniref:Precursor of elicitor peptide 1 n=1 Tax=Raphanus sativus TaxID=3726 RepID=A0A6J0NXD4_RAPSA|nr:precursor of elicitor peptide 1 [Raphanus sativus]KAJ4897234.1 Elicitor peptide 1 [Raphanus sativus]